MTDWQCWVEKAMVRSVTLACVATKLLVLWSYRQNQRKQLGLWTQYAWFTNKAVPSIHDMV